MKKLFSSFAVLLFLSAAALAADRPLVKAWEYTCPFKISAYYSVVDGRGGVAVGDSDLPHNILWFDSKGRPVSISLGSANGYIMYCSPTSLVIGVSSDGMNTWHLRRYSRAGTFTETTEPFNLMIRSNRTTDDLGLFVVGTDNSTLIRYKY
jgi:hypothetical protein